MRSLFAAPNDLHFAPLQFKRKKEKKKIIVLGIKLEIVRYYHKNVVDFSMKNIIIYKIWSNVDDIEPRILVSR